MESRPLYFGLSIGVLKTIRKRLETELKDKDPYSRKRKGIEALICNIDSEIKGKEEGFIAVLKKRVSKEKN